MELERVWLAAAELLLLLVMIVVMVVLWKVGGQTKKVTHRNEEGNE